MRDVFAIAARWLDEKRPFALATLVDLRQAATAPVGTTIAVDASGQVFGNIGAGCYESDIVEACLRTAADGKARLLDINLTSDDVILGGTACGAVMQLLVWRPDAAFAQIAESRSYFPEIAKFQGSLSQAAAGHHRDSIGHAAIDLDEGHQALSVGARGVIQGEHAQTIKGHPQAQNLPGAQVSVGLLRQLFVLFQGFQRHARWTSSIIRPEDGSAR